MTYSEFKSSINKDSPLEVNELLIALWYDAKGNWEKAHKITQDINGNDAAWVHAYLHRKEGDSGNASYWYSRAGKSFSNKILDEEWEEIANELFNRE